MTSATTDRRLGLTGNTGMKSPVDCATTANITLSGEQTIDGVTTSTSRVLVKNQTNAVENGIYKTGSGAWTRDIDANGNYDWKTGTLVPVGGGTSQAFSIYQLTTTGTITVDTSSLNFSVAFTAQAVSAYIQTLLNDADAAEARATLGVAPRATRIDIASVAGTVDLTTNAPNTDDIRLTGSNAITKFTVAAGRVFRVTSGGAFTLTNNSNIVTQTGSDITSASGATFQLRATAADTVEVLNYTSTTSGSSQEQPVTCTQSGGALTFGLNPTTLDFRSSTLTTGVPNTRTIGTALSLSLPSGGTLGGVSGATTRIAMLAIDNGGTSQELAVVNAYGGVALGENGVISTTAISAGSTSATVIYSTTARSNVPYRLVGYADVINTAGAWGSPTLVQPMGGNAYKQLPVASIVRVNTANGYGAVNTTIRRFTNIVENKGSDITYADSANSGGSFTINTYGLYMVMFMENLNATNYFGVSRNSTQLTTNIQSITPENIIAFSCTPANDVPASASGFVYCNPGDVIRAHGVGQASGATMYALFSIAKMS